MLAVGGAFFPGNWSRFSSLIGFGKEVPRVELHSRLVGIDLERATRRFVGGTSNKCQET